MYRGQGPFHIATCMLHGASFIFCTLASGLAHWDDDSTFHIATFSVYKMIQMVLTTCITSRSAFFREMFLN